jgi:Holliday junction resolvase-like predicted endonuclease
LAANPQVDHAVVTASEIDPATWRNIRLRMQKQHGGTLEIVLLRPLAWLVQQLDEFEQLTRADSHSSALGHAVWSGQDHAGVQLDSDVGQDTCRIHLALPELGAVGPAEVLAIEPCPPLASGPGRTVTGTFAHSAADVLDLEIEGLDTPLGCTANHPFWSADRQDFVPAGSLTIGEHLQTESGTLRQVTRITPRRGPPVAVFNLEVDAEHVYYVSTAGVLVHNTYANTRLGNLAENHSRKLLEQRGYTILADVRNASGHGIDVIAEYTTRSGAKRLLVVEVKANRSAMSSLQRMGSYRYLLDVLRRAENWSGPGQIAAAAIRQRLRNGEAIRGILMRLDMKSPKLPVTTVVPW